MTESTPSTSWPDADLADTARVRRLQLVRAGQWFAGDMAEPLALLLRGLGDDARDAAAIETLRGAGPVVDSPRLGAWAVTSADVARAALADGSWSALGSGGGWPTAAVPPRADGDLLDAADATAAAARAAGEDLVASARATTVQVTGRRVETARDAVATFLADGLGLPDEARPDLLAALTATRRGHDARLVPQTLVDLHELEAGRARLRALLTTSALSGSVPPDVALTLVAHVAEPTTQLLARALGDVAQGGRVDVASHARERPPVRLHPLVAAAGSQVGTLSTDVDRLVVAVGLTDPAVDRVGVDAWSVAVVEHLLGGTNVAAAPAPTSPVRRSAVLAARADAPTVA